MYKTNSIAITIYEIPLHGVCQPSQDTSCLVRAFSLSLSAFEDRRVSSRRWRAIIHHVLILSCVLMVPRFLVLSSRPSTLGCLWQPPFKSNPNCDRDRNCNAPTRRSSPPPQHPSASQLSLTSRTFSVSTETYITYCSVLTSPATPRVLIRVAFSLESLQSAMQLK